MARCYLPASSGGPINAGLLGIAARRDCPFHPLQAEPAMGDCARPVTRGLAFASLCAQNTRYRVPTLTRLCCSDPHLIPGPCGSSFQWTAVSCYVALCSPDVPPVLCFQNCTSGSLAGFTPPLSRLPTTDDPVYIHIPERVDQFVQNQAPS